MLADTLNDAGLDARVFLKPSVRIDWTPKLIKAHIWKPIQEAMYEKKSTTELDTKQVSRIYENINRALSEKYPEMPHVPFPSSEPPMIESI